MATAIRRETSWSTRTVCRETIALGAVCMLDLAFTVFLIASGKAWEANPLMAYFLQFGLGAFCAAKLFFVVPPLMVAEWYRPQNDRLIRRVLRFVTITYIVVWVIGVLTLNGIV